MWKSCELRKENYGLTVFCGFGNNFVAMCQIRIYFEWECTLKILEFWNHHLSPGMSLSGMCCFFPNLRKKHSAKVQITSKSEINEAPINNPMRPPKSQSRLSRLYNSSSVTCSVTKSLWKTLRWIRLFFTRSRLTSSALMLKNLLSTSIANYANDK